MLLVWFDPWSARDIWERVSVVSHVDGVPQPSVARVEKGLEEGCCGPIQLIWRRRWYSQRILLLQQSEKKFRKFFSGPPSVARFFFCFPFPLRVIRKKSADTRVALCERPSAMEFIESHLVCISLCHVKLVSRTMYDIAMLTYKVIGNRNTHFLTYDD